MIVGGAFTVRMLYPADFTEKHVFLAPGTFPRDISNALQDSGVVRSGFILHVILYVTRTGDNLVPGDYLFEKPQNVFTIARRITSGTFGVEQRKLVVPEGSTNQQIADIAAEAFPDFDKTLFMKQASGKQGYLFPDTYFLLSTSTEEVIEKMTDRFNFQVRMLQAEALNEGRNWNDVVILASILEEEADTLEDFKLVSGILQKRQSIGMPLQVDVARETYERLGLPDQPLSNPGLATLDAVLHPTPSNFLYYLTGKDGLMHYAVTYEEHKQNIDRYLR